MTLFLFGQCQCGYSAVIAAAVLFGGEEVPCPACEALSLLRILPLRPALDSDEPTDLDMRKTPVRRFVCAECGELCLSRSTDSDAAFEYEALHGRPPPKNAETICDDCFKQQHGPMQ